MTPASLGIVTFRRHPPGLDDEVALERINASLADQIEQQGDVSVSTGRVRAGSSCVDLATAPLAPRKDYPGLELGCCAARRSTPRRSARSRSSRRSTTSRRMPYWPPRTSTPRLGRRLRAHTRRDGDVRLPSLA
jgi:hypothetical protein